MNSKLYYIKSKIDQYLRMICSLFEVEVDVCDNHLVRIAGTGSNNQLIGEKLKSGRISLRAMNEQKYIFAKKPLDEETCQGCVNQSVCLNHCGITFPLIYHGSVLGAINITALNPKQEDELIRRQNDFILFMQTICDLVILTLEEYDNYQKQSYNLKLQESLINVINDGVMILDDDNKISFINERCSKILGYNLKQIQYLTRIKKLSVKTYKSKSGNSSTCRISIRNTVINLTGEIYNIGESDANKPSKIFVFYDVRRLHESMLSSMAYKKSTFDSLIGSSPVYRTALNMCKELSYTLAPILLCGEAGSGREPLAYSIHNESTLRSNQCIEISRSENIDALLSNSSLFAGNTIYINEISNFTIENQEALLKIINLGASFNCRVICTTSKDLKSLALSGDFSPELFYTLDVNSVAVPPVRVRGNDILLLAEHFMTLSNKKAHKDIFLSKNIINELLNYTWPGNIRELENTIMYIVEHSPIDEGELDISRLPAAIVNKFDTGKGTDYSLEHMEKQLIIKALNEFSNVPNSKEFIAKKLGISTATLYRKLAKYEITSTTSFK